MDRGRRESCAVGKPVPSGVYGNPSPPRSDAEPVKTTVTRGGGGARARASVRYVNGMSRAIHNARAQHLDGRRRTVHDLCIYLSLSLFPSLLLSLSISLSSLVRPSRAGGESVAAAAAAVVPFRNASSLPLRLQIHP